MLWALRKIWNKRQLVISGVRHVEAVLYALYRKLPLPAGLRRIIREVLFSSLHAIIVKSSHYQAWLNGRSGANRLASILHNGPEFFSRYKRAEAPLLPEEAMWDSVAKPQSGAPIVDVIIPVYKGYNETLACIYSVLANPLQTPYELSVINDASPDAALTRMLRTLGEKGLFTLYENAENLGFVQTVNKGMQLHDDRDVVLLNADAEVYNDWLDRIRAAAYSDASTASITPFSNNAEICSYPFFVKDNYMQLEIDYAALDKVAAHCNKGKQVEIPTAVGFCMYIKRAALQDVGVFDAELFGKGYGEENDFCRRAIAKGWNHKLTGDVFVRHYGGSSFLGEKDARVAVAIKILQEKFPDYLPSVSQFILEDPVRPLRTAIDCGRMVLGKGKAILFVSHNFGGGTEKHIQDMIRLLAEEGIAVYLLRPHTVEPRQVILSAADDILTPNLVFDLDIDQALLLAALQQLQLLRVHVHHVVGFDQSFPDFIAITSKVLAIPYDVTLHDYFTICPRINLIDGSGYYCGEPEITTCERCIRTNHSIAGPVSVWQWRYRFAEFLHQAAHVYVPNMDVSARISRYFPQVRLHVRHHPEAFAASSEAITPLQPGKRLRVAIIGALGPHKGSELILGCVRDAKERNLPIDFYIIGYSNIDHLLKSYTNVTITGSYEEHELQGLLMQYRCDLAFFASLWPETFCYTLSAAVHARLFPVSFDLGAVSERIGVMGWGALLPVSSMKHPAEVNDRLLAVEIKPYPDNLALPTQKELYPDMLRDYYLAE